MNHNTNLHSQTQSGADFRSAETLVLSDVEEWLVGKGYTVKNIGQPWRNVFAHIESDGKEYFFKLASAPGVGERLKNEVDWNTQLCGQQKGFYIPKIHESGLLWERPYYISEYFPGAFVQAMTPGVVDTLEPWLEKIVQCNLTLLERDPCSLNLYRDRDFPSIPEYMTHLSKRIGSWVDEIPERDLTRLRSAAIFTDKTVLTGVNHGDFVPWHMIVHGDQFVLIDGEHGSANTVRYYDVAYFYHRVYTKLESPELAKKYLILLRRRLDPAEHALFDMQFPRVLASRIIGGYFDAKHENTSYEIHDQLQEEFLSGGYMTE